MNSVVLCREKNIFSWEPYNILDLHDILIGQTFWIVRIPVTLSFSIRQHNLTFHELKTSDRNKGYGLFSWLPFILCFSVGDIKVFADTDSWSRVASSLGCLLLFHQVDQLVLRRNRKLSYYSTNIIQIYWNYISFFINSIAQAVCNISFGWHPPLPGVRQSE